MVQVLVSAISTWRAHHSGLELCLNYYMAADYVGRWAHSPRIGRACLLP
ncbi:hypothetical protein ACI0FW_00523 [Alcaligenes nematophilus]|nr:Uncharacterised protein [Alcaligenes faecalis subsp. faecalis]